MLCPEALALLQTSKKGPDTYLNGHANGWPMDQKAEDTFDLPPFFPRQQVCVNDGKPCNCDPDVCCIDRTKHPLNNITATAPEYHAEFGTDGSARLYLTQAQRSFIATFDTMADANRAAEALNNHEGY